MNPWPLSRTRNNLSLTNPQRAIFRLGWTLAVICFSSGAAAVRRKKRWQRSPVRRQFPSARPPMSVEPGQDHGSRQRFWPIRARAALLPFSLFLKLSTKYSADFSRLRRIHLSLVQSSLIQFNASSNRSFLVGRSKGRCETSVSPALLGSEPAVRLEGSF